MRRDAMISFKDHLATLRATLRVQIYELRVQIHELQVQIYELRVQIDEFGD